MSTLIGEEVGVLALSCLPTYEEAILTSPRSLEEKPGVYPERARAPPYGSGTGSYITALAVLSRFVFLLDRGLDIYVWRGAQATLSNTTKAR